MIKFIIILFTSIITAYFVTPYVFLALMFISPISLYIYAKKKFIGDDLIKLMSIKVTNARVSYRTSPRSVDKELVLPGKIGELNARRVLSESVLTEASERDLRSMLRSIGVENVKFNSVYSGSSNKAYIYLDDFEFKDFACSNLIRKDENLLYVTSCQGKVYLDDITLLHLLKMREINKQLVDDKYYIYKNGWQSNLKLFASIILVTIACTMVDSSHVSRFIILSWFATVAAIVSFRYIRSMVSVIKVSNKLMRHKDTFTDYAQEFSINLDMLEINGFNVKESNYNYIQTEQSYTRLQVMLANLAWQMLIFSLINLILWMVVLTIFSNGFY